MIDAENFVWTSIDGTGVTSVTTSGPDGDIIIGISIVGQ